jgi:hypothetical protein
MGMGQAKKDSGRGISIIAASPFLVLNIAYDQYCCKSIIMHIAACILCAMKALLYDLRISEMQQ